MTTKSSLQVSEVPRVIDSEHGMSSENPQQLPEKWRDVKEGESQMLSTDMGLLICVTVESYLTFLMLSIHFGESRLRIPALLSCETQGRKNIIECVPN